MMRPRDDNENTVPGQKSAKGKDVADGPSLAGRLEALGREVVRIEKDPGACPAEAQHDFADWQLDIRRALMLLGNRLAEVKGSGPPSDRTGRELGDLVSRIEQEFEQARARFGF